AGLRGVSSSELNGTVPEPLPRINDSWWCAGVDYAQVLRGEVDYLLFSKDWPWDHVPGALMLSELGGHAGRLDGRPCDSRTRGGWVLAAGTGGGCGLARGGRAGRLGGWSTAWLSGGVRAGGGAAPMAQRIRQ